VRTIPEEERPVPNIGLPELLIILLILVLIFGAGRLAGLGRGLGQAIRGFKSEMKDQKDDKDRPE